MKHSLVYLALVVVCVVTLSSTAAHAAAVPTVTVSAAASTCMPPAAGILFCSPYYGSFQPTNSVQASVAARGNNSAITRMQIFIDGFLMQDSAAASSQFTAGFGNAGTHTFSAKAWDKAGHVYAATTKFTTYYDGICSPKGCAPGVFISAPNNGSTVKGAIALRASVEGNPAPVTAMRAYLDGRLVASSSGPTMIANIDAAAGKHTLIVQAWDTKGHLYKTIETVTVQ